MKGNLEYIEQLDPIMFNKAEGITFYDNGDMLITNEGQDKKHFCCGIKTDVDERNRR